MITARSLRSDAYTSTAFQVSFYLIDDLFRHGNGLRFIRPERTPEVRMCSLSDPRLRIPEDHVTPPGVPPDPFHVRRKGLFTGRHWVSVHPHEAPGEIARGLDVALGRTDHLPAKRFLPTTTATTVPGPGRDGQDLCLDLLCRFPARTPKFTLDPVMPRGQLGVASKVLLELLQLLDALLRLRRSLRHATSWLCSGHPHEAMKRT